MKNKINFSDFIFTSQRQRMSPFPNYMSMESVCKEMMRFVGVKLGKIIFFFEGNIFFAFAEKKSYENAGKTLTKKIIADPGLVAKIIRQQKLFGHELVSYCRRVHREVNAKTSRQKLFQIYSGYEKRYKNVYATYGWVWMAEDVFSAELLKIIEQRIGKSSRAVDILNILTRQPKAMVALAERRSLLELALKIKPGSEWQTSAAVKKLIANHVRKYFWVTRDYEDPVITAADVVRRMGEALKNNPKKQHQLIINDLRQDEELKKKYQHELKLTAREKQLFKAMLDIAYLKELRKTHVSQSLYYFDKVLEAIGKKLFVSIRQVRFFRTKDLNQALIKNLDFSAELNQRLKMSVWVCSGRGTEVITGKEAEKLFSKFCEVDKNKTEFFGLPVSPGIARGPAKIVIHPDECGKVNKGDIIVSIQVVPSFSTAIIKSAGLICDGGHGITSHPATLAREAGIPCVIQTRFFREVVKDGGIVEVDGYKGVARILKKAR